MSDNSSFLPRRREPGPSLGHTDRHAPGTPGRGRWGSARLGLHPLSDTLPGLRGTCLARPTISPFPGPSAPFLSSCPCISPPGLSLSWGNSVLRALFVTIWLALSLQGRAPKPQQEPVLPESVWKVYLSGTEQMSKYRQMAGPSTCWAVTPTTEKEIWGDFEGKKSSRKQCTCECVWAQDDLKCQRTGQ